MLDGLVHCPHKKNDCSEPAQDGEIHPSRLVLARYEQNECSPHAAFLIVMHFWRGRGTARPHLCLLRLSSKRFALLDFGEHLLDRVFFFKIRESVFDVLAEKLNLRLTDGLGAIDLAVHAIERC